MNSSVQTDQGARTNVDLFAKIDTSSVVVAALEVCKNLKNAGFEAFFVGGAVRDVLIESEKPPKDIDITTSAAPEDVQKLFPKTSFVGQSFGVCMVKLRQHGFEVATFRKDGTYSNRRHPDNVSIGTQYQDSLRRDFTINALYFDPIDCVLVDFHNGQVDLKNRLIRCVGVAEQRLHEDALRIIRLYRFAARFGFQIESKTAAACVHERDGLNLLSRERIVMEIEKVPEGKLNAFVDLIEQGIGLDWLIKSWSSTHHVGAPEMLALRHQSLPVSAFAVTLLGKKSYDSNLRKTVYDILRSWPMSSLDATILKYLLVSLQTLESKQSTLLAACAQIVLQIKRFRHAPASLVAQLSLPFFSRQAQISNCLRIFLIELSNVRSDADCPTVLEQKKQSIGSWMPVDKIVKSIEAASLSKSLIATWIAWQEFASIAPSCSHFIPAEGSDDFLNQLKETNV